MLRHMKHSLCASCFCLLIGSAILFRVFAVAVVAVVVLALALFAFQLNPKRLSMSDSLSIFPSKPPPPRSQLCPSRSHFACRRCDIDLCDLPVDCWVRDCCTYCTLCCVTLHCITSVHRIKVTLLANRSW